MIARLWPTSSFVQAHRVRWVLIPLFSTVAACGAGSLPTPQIDPSAVPLEPPGSFCRTAESVCPDLSLVGGVARAWVVADDPASAGYAPSPSNQFNSTGGTNRILRRNVGTYTVELPGILRAGGTVLVSAVGGPNWCNVERWTPTGEGQEVSVLCYQPDYEPTDTPFTLLFYREGREAPTSRAQAAYLWWGGGIPGRERTTYPGPPPDYEWIPEVAIADWLYSWGSDGGVLEVTSFPEGYTGSTPAPRQKRVSLPSYPPVGPGWATAYGELGQYCVFHAPMYYPSQASIECFVEPLLEYQYRRGMAIQAFTATTLTDPSPGTRSGEETHGGWAVHSPPETTGCYVPRSGRNTGGLDPTVCRTAMGEYTVNFEGLPGSARNNPIVGGGTPGRRCSTSSWGASGEGIDVTVSCFDRDGDPADSGFTLLLLTDARR